MNSEKILDFSRFYAIFVGERDFFVVQKGQKPTVRHGKRRNFF